MPPFEYERLERPDDSICVYHNVTMLESVGSINKGDYFTKAKFNVDRKLIEFYFLDKVTHAFYIEIDFVELEQA